MLAERITVSPLFDERVDRTAGPDACWPWIGSRSSGEFQRTLYRRVQVTRDGMRRTCNASQAAYFLATGRWERRHEGRVVRHLCHYSLCCNPAHLAGGTQRDNKLDLRYEAEGLFAPQDHRVPGPARALPVRTINLIAQMGREAALDRAIRRRAWRAALPLHLRSPA